MYDYKPYLTFPKIVYKSWNNLQGPTKKEFLDQCVMLQLLSGGTVFHALATDKESHVLKWKYE
jgi:hypothetical protein